jgi:hypothetical protein
VREAIEQEKKMNTKIKCGNCKGDHETPEEVRACYAGKILAGSSVAPSAIAPNWDRNTVGTSRSAVPSALLAGDRITTKQEDYLNKLLNDRPMFRDVENLWPENIAKLSKSDASAKISEVLAVPKESRGDDSKTFAGSSELTEILEGIDDGYFALPSKTGTNDLDFIRLSSNQGRGNPANKGKRWVQRFLGGQGLIEIRMTEQIEFARLVIALTSVGREKAQALFGQEIGRCGCCGKSLTDETSRSIGIGPKCRQHS